MEVRASRHAIPIRVHQLWDSISNGQVADYENLMSNMTTAHKIPKDELNHQLTNAIKDGLIVTGVLKSHEREETEIYKLPDASTIVRGDHDWYCFQCHLPGPVLKCEDCPRVYHLECLPEDRKPEKDLFVCPACYNVHQHPSTAKVVVKQKILNQLLLYICDRFKSWQIDLLEKANGELWAKAANRKDNWRFDLLVYFPMDLETMISKAKAGTYASLEEFQLDCETLVHAIAVYFGLDMLKGGQIGQAFLRDAVHDIQEIKLCHDCFRRSNEKNHDWWFCLPCSTPHDVVWAKQTGYPYWPAKVMKKDGNKYDVRYFGGNYERGIIDGKNIQPIETSINQLKVRRTALWNDAFGELQKFQEIAKNPDLVAKLPPKKGGTPTVKGKAGKRGANQSPEEVVTKKSRKSEAASTPVAPKTRKSGAAKGKATPQANGTSPSAPAPNISPAKKKVTTKSATASTPARRESTSTSKTISGTTPASGSSTKIVKATDTPKEKKPYTDLLDTNLEPDVIAFLNSVDDTESLDGEAVFSDEESNDTHEKVSEDAVSSSCNESKSTRNVYVQVAHQGLVRDKLIKKFIELQTRHTSELSQNKKKQWCYNCEREAIYHCCWNTAYCSIECQQVHWTREHKRMCRRKKPV